MNKASEAILSSFWRSLGKIYLSLTLSKTDGRVPSQQGAPTTCNLTYWEVSQQTYVQTLLSSLGVVIGQNSEPSSGGRVHKKLGVGVVPGFSCNFLNTCKILKAICRSYAKEMSLLLESYPSTFTKRNFYYKIKTNYSSCAYLDLTRKNPSRKT